MINSVIKLTVIFLMLVNNNYCKKQIQENILTSTIKYNKKGIITYPDGLPCYTTAPVIDDVLTTSINRMHFIKNITMNEIPYRTIINYSQSNQVNLNLSIKILDNYQLTSWAQTNWNGQDCYVLQYFLYPIPDYNISKDNLVGQWEFNGNYEGSFPVAGTISLQADNGFIFKGYKTQKFISKGKWEFNSNLHTIQLIFEDQHSQWDNTFRFASPYILPDILFIDSKKYIAEFFIKLDSSYYINFFGWNFRRIS